MQTVQVYVCGVASLYVRVRLVNSRTRPRGHGPREVPLQLHECSHWLFSASSHRDHECTYVQKTAELASSDARMCGLVSESHDHS